MSKINAPFTVRDIESAVEQGREAERERIIALLETADRNCCQRGRCRICASMKSAIALIKGEN